MTSLRDSDVTRRDRAAIPALQSSGAAQPKMHSVGCRRKVAVPGVNACLLSVSLRPMFVQVEAVAVLHHPCIVRLLGYCVDFDAATETYEQIMVYEFIPNGDLKQFQAKRE